jgi:hypothetical protein
MQYRTQNLIIEVGFTWPSHSSHFRCNALRKKSHWALNKHYVWWKKYCGSKERHRRYKHTFKFIAHSQWKWRPWFTSCTLCDVPRGWAQKLSYKPLNYRSPVYQSDLIMPTYLSDARLICHRTEAIITKPKWVMSSLYMLYHSWSSVWWTISKLCSYTFS